MNNISKLTGLSESSVLVYKELLKLGICTMGPIIKSTKLQKSTVFYALADLEAEGLIEVSMRNNIKNFVAQQPKILLEKAKDLENEMEKIVKELELTQNLENEKITSSIYEGFKAVMSSLQHRLSVLKKGDEILIFGSLSSNPESTTAVVAIQKINTELIRRGVKLRVIFNNKLKDSTLANFYKKLPGCKMKYIQEEVPLGIALYHDFVYTLVWDNTQNPTAVLTKSESISGCYKKFFEDMWRRN